MYVQFQVLIYTVIRKLNVIHCAMFIENQEYSIYESSRSISVKLGIMDRIYWICIIYSFCHYNTCSFNIDSEWQMRIISWQFYLLSEFFSWRLPRENRSWDLNHQFESTTNTLRLRLRLLVPASQCRVREFTIV